MDRIINETENEGGGKKMKTSEMEREREGERSLLCKEKTAAKFFPRCEGFHQPT
jgi:hypothetical protein